LTQQSLSPNKLFAQIHFIFAEYLQQCSRINTDRICFCCSDILMQKSNWNDRFSPLCMFYTWMSALLSKYIIIHYHLA